MRYWKLIAAVVLLALLVVATQLLPVGTWIEAFQAYVRSAGTAGYVLYVLAFVVCCVLVVPALPLTLGAGAIFGVTAGTVVVLIGATLGAAAAFLLGRTAFRRRVEEMTATNPKLAAVDRAIATEGTKIMLLMRLSGFPPFTWINYGLSVTGVRFVPYLLTTLFGMIPGSVAYTYVGAAGAAAVTGSGNRTALIVTAIGAVAVVTYLARIASQAIRRAGVER